MPNPHAQRLSPVVLIVDDDITMRLLMREVLEQAGFTVEEAEDGAAAVAIFPQLQPDLVLLDVMMPDLDGFEGCTLIRQLPEGQRIPILLVTGLEDLESIQHAYDAGATDFITKPIVWPMLTRRLRYLLRASRAIDEVHLSKEELRAAHSQLEKRVAERTAELQFSTEMLKREISERKRVEKELQRSEQHFRSLIENGSDIITILDMDGRARYQSSAITRVLGYSTEELIGTDAFSLIHPEDLPRTRETFACVLQNPGAVFSVEFRFRHRNGAWRYLESTVSLSSHDAEGVQIVVNSRDITERKKAEEALALRDRAIAAISEGLCITDPHQPGNPIIYVNAGFEHITGYSQDEMIGKTCQILQGPGTDRATIAQLSVAIRAEQECVAELLNYRKNGEPFWNRVAIAPVRNAEGRVTHFIGLQSDITERKEMERLKNELVSTVSHELRTPLTSLRGFTELMLKRSFSVEKQREFLKVIHKESMRLTELINDFLDLQRIEAGRQTYNFEDVFPAALLAETASVFNLEGGSHTLQLMVPASLPTVHIDSARIQQVLTNLLSNAIKFSPQGGPIIIGAIVENDAVKVWVQDQGIGIPTEAVPNLFSKFFRVDNQDTRQIGGTGLGLALVKEIIEDHGGRVWVESGVGKGSTFFFTLPISEASPAISAQPPNLELNLAQASSAPQPPFNEALL